MGSSTVDLPPDQAEALGDRENGDEEEDEDDEDEEEEVLLGHCVGPVDPDDFAPIRFPSKVGGAPVWLDPINLPSGESICCQVCEKPLDFLLQVYGPVDSVECAFHRTVYLFACRNLQCLREHSRTHNEEDRVHEGAGEGSAASPYLPKKSVRAFRCQLPRANQFYPYDAPELADEQILLPAIQSTPPLCEWCATWKAEKRCGGCRRSHYCSRSHQVDHWRGGHAPECRQFQAQAKESEPGPSGRTADSISSDHVDRAAAAPRVKPVNPRVWPEYVLEVEPEPTELAANGDGDEDGLNATANGKEDGSTEGSTARDKIAALLADYQRRLKEGDSDYPTEELRETEEGIASLHEGQKQWADFESRVARAPQQCLRYCFSERAKPLWPQLAYRPTHSRIAACTRCMSTRIFEFQVLPQILYFLKVDSSDENALDFSTIAVYTCANSCDTQLAGGSGGGGGKEGSYVEELVWVQPPP